MTEYSNLINGQWKKSVSDKKFVSTNPANPKEEIGVFTNSTREETVEAIVTAAEAFKSWSQMPPPARGEILYKASQEIDKNFEELATTLTKDEGKTISSARGEIARGRDIFRYFGSHGWRAMGSVMPPYQQNQMLYSFREPLGVVSIITPWNFPFALCSWKIAPALIYGNTVVFKPASPAPLIGLKLVECLVNAGIPNGVINAVIGFGSVVGDEMATNPLVSAISFTGSVGVGKQVYANGAKHSARVQCELGGKNPLVVLRDADIKLAAKLAVVGGFGLTGQACTATSRVIVENAIADEFVNELVRQTKEQIVGDGMDPKTNVGPVVDKSQLETDTNYIQIGVEEGANLLIGGTVQEGTLFFSPAIFDHVKPEMRIAQEEIFGPVISVIRVDDFDEAMTVANGVEFGLSAGVVTNDLRKAFDFAQRIQAGVVKINDITTGLLLHLPFGGFKNSSVNTFKEQGEAAVEFYTRLKTVYLNY